jgi:DUF1365 family protein
MRADAAPLASGLYHGVVRHRRLRPFRHEFRYSVFLAYLDLDELDRVFAGRWWWSTRRPAVARFCRDDYLPDTSPRPLAEAARDIVEKRLGVRPAGPVRLLTNLRYWGYRINPISLYYCFDATAARVEAVVAEVTNTPWGDRHCYVVPGPATLRDRTWRATLPKDLHVSPFFPMDMEYRWLLSAPGERLSVEIESHRRGEWQFDATLALERREITGATLAGALLRHPWMAGRVAAGIYWQALRLWWKGAEFHPHPRTLGSDESAGGRRTAVTAEPQSCGVHVPS